MACVGKLPWKKVPHYFAAQYVGAFLGAVVTYVIYAEAIIKVFGYNLLTAGIFGTLPNGDISLTTCAIDQVYSNLADC